ncbi:MAG TPA: polyprenyl synthetase family protein [Rhodothermales bacterium]|nr:polyprenyl synthetase family protein [Rhodothermales bacterium]
MSLTLKETSPAEHVNGLGALVNSALADLARSRQPAELYDPVRYVLEGGGKRFRPILLLLAAECFGVKHEQSLPAALAVEVFHNFTLVHDDIMDHAIERRARPTVHVKWDESTAILAGDFLMALSYDLLARLRTDRLPELLHVYYEMVAHLCEGQALDKAFEERSSVSVDAYLDMIDRKTGALLRACLQMGGILGDASAAEQDALRALGTNLGRAFQVQDDLLDLTADDDRWGKAIGGDLAEAKKTFLLLSALESAEGEDRAWFARIVDRHGLEPERVEEARARMERLGVLERARGAVVSYSDAALACTHALPGAAARASLQWLIRRMQERLH